MTDAEFEVKLAAWKARGPKPPRHKRVPREQYEAVIARQNTTQQKLVAMRGAMPWKRELR